MLGGDFRGGEVIKGFVAPALRLSLASASGRRHVAGTLKLPYGEVRVGRN